jgi:hypothetical protein
MSVFLIFLVACLIGGIITAFAKKLWIVFKWRILGIKPNILNDKEVQRTSDECAAATLGANMLEAASAGVTPTEEEQAERLKQLQEYNRLLIERYIENFMLRG